MAIDTEEIGVTPIVARDADRVVRGREDNHPILVAPRFDLDLYQSATIFESQIEAVVAAEWHEHPKARLHESRYDRYLGPFADL